MLSEFGGSFPTPTSVDANTPSPQKGYFVDGLEYVLNGFKWALIFFFFSYSVIAPHVHKVAHRASPRVARGVPHARAHVRRGSPNEFHVVTRTKIGSLYTHGVFDTRARRVACASCGQRWRPYVRYVATGTPG